MTRRDQLIAKNKPFNCCKLLKMQPYNGITIEPMVLDLHARTPVLRVQ